MNHHKIMLLLQVCLFLCQTLVAQEEGFIQVFEPANETEAIQMIDELFGINGTVSNVSINCNLNAFGNFTQEPFFWENNEGIVLCTGNISDIAGPNSATNTSSDLDDVINSFENLQALAPNNTQLHDICVIEFDYQPNVNYLEFMYYFGSEEYPERVCEPADIMGIFITGTGPGIQYENYNISSQELGEFPISPTTINRGINGTPCENPYGQFCPCADWLFLDDDFGFELQEFYEYDGFTWNFYNAVDVTPCETYRIQLSIADVGDALFDSAFFFSMNGQSPIETTATATTGWENLGYFTAIEGCLPMNVTLNLATPNNSSEPLTVNITSTGTADWGTDFSLSSPVVVIPPFSSTGTVEVFPLIDDETEGQETAQLSFELDADCSQVSTVTASFFIADPFGAEALVNEYQICQGNSAILGVEGGESYAWSPSTNLSTPNEAYTVATPDVTTLYECVVNLGPCFDTITVLVEVDLCVGIDDFDLEQIQIYPNPVGDLLHFNSGREVLEGEIEIYDMKGTRLMLLEQFSDRISVGHLPSGTYFFKWESSSQRLTRKFFKK